MKMRKIALGLLLATAVAGGGLSGCKKALDVNQNPNALTDVTARQLLSSAEVQIAQAYGNYFTVVGGIWAQYWTQNPVASQYKPFDQYAPGPSTANNAWSLLYAGALTDLQRLIDKGESDNYTAVAMLLKAYTFQLLTDNFGDIPFSEALKGEQGVTSPRFEGQRAVYNGVIQMTKDALALIDLDGTYPENDVIFGGDMHHWEEFGNTLLLRMHLRLSEVDPGFAQAGIQALSATNPVFLDAVGADVFYSTLAGNNNPLYSEAHTIGNQNLIASSTAVDSFRLRQDPRLSVFYFANGTNYRGLLQGFFGNDNPTATTTTYAYPGAAVGGIANPNAALEEQTQSAPVRLLSRYESLFLQAEAQARGWMSGTAATTYRDAIVANFQDYGISTTSAASRRYIDTVAAYGGGSVENQIEQIITEKYYAMCGNQNIEAWTEWRRTGYPDFFVLSAAPGALRQFPVRLPYPETELTRNVNFPGQKAVTERVYWDVR